MNKALPVSQLLIINYSMDDSDPLLAHQIEAVRVLASSFTQVHVVTSRRGTGSVPDNVTIDNIRWGSNSSFRNILNLYKSTIPFLTKRGVVVFSHMTDVQCALIAPLTRFLKVRHFLWYAHTTYSKFLWWSQIWVDGIITSTRGSCPVPGRKVYPIGQALDPEIFYFSPKVANRFEKGVHIGRFDKSKNISLIAKVCEELLLENRKLTFTQIGNPSTSSALSYAEDFKVRYASQIADGRFAMLPSIARSELLDTLKKFDFFIHAYQGSLDKTLIEATMIGLPVITINREYHIEFGTWSHELSPTLMQEYLAARSIPPSKMVEILERRRQKSVNHHSISKWKEKLLNILVKF